MEYNFSKDLIAIRELMGISRLELAKYVDVQEVTLSRNEFGKTKPSDNTLEKVYSFAFDKKIKLNQLKEMLWLESIKPGHKLLFHGAKSRIDGNIDINIGRSNNDLGRGFYTGENYVQAASFISGYTKPSVYILDFNPHGLRAKKYEVDQEWMLTIAYYRGTLDAYKDHPKVKDLIAQSRDCDYIMAPIADNRMFQIINSFIIGEITDEQCKHCLAATNLGYQYVFTNEKAVKNLKILERCYISAKEREYYINIRSEDSKLGEDKVKLARIQFRGKGKYIDEILV